MRSSLFVAERRSYFDLLASPCRLLDQILSSTVWSPAVTNRLFSLVLCIFVLTTSLSVKFKFHWNLTRITFTLHEDQYKFLFMSRLFLQWEMFQTKPIEKIKTRILFSITFFFLSFENRTIYEIMWKNIVERGSPMWQYGACAMHAGYLKLQTSTLRICNTHCFSTATVVARWVSMWRYSTLQSC